MHVKKRATSRGSQERPGNKRQAKRTKTQAAKRQAAAPQVEGGAASQQEAVAGDEAPADGNQRADVNESEPAAATKDDGPSEGLPAAHRKIKQQVLHVQTGMQDALKLCKRPYETQRLVLERITLTHEYALPYGSSNLSELPNDAFVDQPA